MTKKIGILGGIGPEATGDFYLKLIGALQNRRLVVANTEFPNIFVNSIPAPELLHDFEEDSKIQPYIDGVKTLASLDPDFIIMVCNTIHLYYDKIVEATGYKSIISLRDQVYKVLIKHVGKKISILGTRLTVGNGLYHYVGINYQNPNNEQLDELSSIILDFNMGGSKEELLRRLKSVMEQLEKEGAQLFVAACTEISELLSLNNDGGKYYVDTLDIMLESVISRLTTQS